MTALRVRCQSRALFIAAVAEALFGSGGPDTPVWWTLIRTKCLDWAEPIAQRLIEDHRVHFIFDEDET